MFLVEVRNGMVFLLVFNKNWNAGNTLRIILIILFGNNNVIRLFAIFPELREIGTLSTLISDSFGLID